MERCKSICPLACQADETRKVADGVVRTSFVRKPILGLKIGPVVGTVSALVLNGNMDVAREGAQIPDEATACNTMQDLHKFAQRPGSNAQISTLSCPHTRASDSAFASPGTYRG